jgi:hypothetical protein
MRSSLFAACFSRMMSEGPAVTDTPLQTQGRNNYNTTAAMSMPPGKEVGLLDSAAWGKQIRLVLDEGTSEGGAREKHNRMRGGHPASLNL